MQIENRKLIRINFWYSITIKITITVNNITYLAKHHLIKNNNSIQTIYKYNTIETYGNNKCYRTSNYYKTLKYKNQTFST
jgi:hypothetical protein